MDTVPRSPDATERFSELLGRAERLRAVALPFDELRELGRLYRLHAAELARLRDRDEDPAAIRHRNALCVRAYSFLYASRRERHGWRHLFLERLPDALARTWRAQALAWLLLAAGAVVGATLGLRDPEAVHALVPASFGYSEARLDALLDSPQARAVFLAGQDVPATRNALFGSSLFVHNTRVALLGFATGILAGIPTLLLQLYNGLLLGAFGAIFLRDPAPVAFLAWILPHGIPELTAITLCTAAGLLLGEAVAAPGRQGRRRALREAMDPALLLFGAAIPLLGAAALVESFVRESTLGNGPRLAVAGVFAVALLAGLAATRRLARRRTADASWLRDLTSSLPEGPDNGSTGRS
jgi:uncharacterized membrane protein SpoIIM required for sporulation